MKERILKWVVPLFLAAVIVVAGVLSGLPGKSQAAAKGTTYNVLLLKPSPLMSIVSINNGSSFPQPGANDGITFQMVVDTKAKTEKLKTGPATYYPVTIPAKSFKVPPTPYQGQGGGGGTVQTTTIMTGDANGKLYTSGGAVDVSSVMGSKLTTTIDGTVGPPGSLVIPIATATTVTMAGKPYMNFKMVMYMTTGLNYIIVKGSKSGLEGKALPDADTTGLLSKPMVGKPLNLDAGTGTLAGTTCVMNVKSSQGKTDMLIGEVWVMKITK